MDKRIAPTVWSLIIIAVILLYGAVFVMVPILIVRAISFVATACLVGAILWVLRERYHEIKGGETDDLEHY